MSDLVSTEDLAQLKEIMEDEFEMLTTMFIEDSSQLVEQIKELYAAGNAADLRVAAHTLKGSSSNMSALGFSEICKIIEDKAKEGDLNGLDDTIEQLSAAHPQVIQILQSV